MNNRSQDKNNVLAQGKEVSVQRCRCGDIRNHNLVHNPLRLVTMKQRQTLNEGLIIVIIILLAISVFMQIIKGG